MIQRPWTEREDAFLRECANARIATALIAPLLDRSEAAIRVRRHGMGLPPPRGFQINYDRHSLCVSVARTKRVVAAHFGIPVEEMVSPNRERGVARSRQVAMFLAREIGQRSYPNIGFMFGGRDHSTVIYSVRAVKRLMGESSEFKHKVETLERELVSGDANSIVDEREKVSFVSFSASA
jgi:hypothetical protein